MPTEPCPATTTQQHGVLHGVIDRRRQTRTVVVAATATMATAGATRRARRRRYRPVRRIALGAIAAVAALQTPQQAATRGVDRATRSHGRITCNTERNSGTLRIVVDDTFHEQHPNLVIGAKLAGLCHCDPCWNRQRIGRDVQLAAVHKRAARDHAGVERRELRETVVHHSTARDRHRSSTRGTQDPARFHAQGPSGDRQVGWIQLTRNYQGPAADCDVFHGAMACQGKGGVRGGQRDVRAGLQAGTLAIAEERRAAGGTGR